MVLASPSAVTVRALFILTLLLTLLGCADDDAESLRVRGAAVLVLDGTSSGFEFDGDRLLEDDRIGRYDRVAGHCTVDRGVDGEPDVVSLSLSLPDAVETEGDGARAFRVRLEGESAGKVTAMMGETEFSSDLGGECSATELYRDLDAGLIGLDVDCEIRDETGRSASATADLHSGGCEVL